MLNFNHLYYFHVIAAEGSLKGAADRLGVTHPTISEQLKLLERTLEVELFERTSSGLRLTQAGREAVEHTTAMFLAGERLVEALGQRGQQSDVVLRVGVTASMVRTTAADFLLPLLTFDECQASIRTGDFSELLRELRARRLDLLVAETEPDDIARSGLAVELISKPTLVAVATPDVSPKPDWDGLPLLAYRSSSVYHWVVEGYLQERLLKPKVMAELDDAFLMLEAVLRGHHAAFLPESMARAAIDDGRLRVLATIAPERAGLYAVYPDRDSLQLARNAVARLIAQSRGNARPA